jgi:hydroxymethylpyrimidine/phosphomethylpyrimidine kinase
MTPPKTTASDPSIKRILVVAESDPTGASGIQGDVKTALALGGYAATAITYMASVDHENVKPPPVAPAYIAEQMRTAMACSMPDSIKIGYLDSEEAINAVSDVLDDIRSKNIPVVVDPSIIGRSGRVLVDDKAIAAWKRRLYIHAKVLTPNLREAELLGIMKIQDIDDMRHGADMMRSLGVESVVLKGGQAEIGKELYFVSANDEERIYQRETIKTRHTLGAGAAFSTAIAVHLSHGLGVLDSTERALDFVHQAIVHSGGFGDESGAINHAFDIQSRPSIFHPEDIKIYKV